VFVDGQYQGSANDISHYGGTENVSVPLTGSFAPASTHSLWIVSESFGYPSSVVVPTQSGFPRGIVGAIAVGGVSIASEQWTTRSDLAGNMWQVWSPAGANTVQWTPGFSTAPLTWLQTSFQAPFLAANQSLLLNVTGLGRGHAFVNGFDLGRYWTILRNDGSNVPSQGLYPIPIDVINQGGSNRLVFGEILGATNPSLPSVVLVSLAAGPSSVPYSTWSSTVYDCQYQ
jgi:hypothetical protein